MLTRAARKVLVFAGGGILAILGLVMLVTPGPGIPVLIAGLALLSIEFEWAERRLHRLRSTARELWRKPSGN